MGPKIRAPIVAPKRPAEYAQENIPGDIFSCAAIRGPATPIAWLSTPSRSATKAHNTNTRICSTETGLSSIRPATSMSLKAGTVIARAPEYFAHPPDTQYKKRLRSSSAEMSPQMSLNIRRVVTGHDDD